jgi:hypothetical protein
MSMLYVDRSPTAPPHRLRSRAVLAMVVAACSCAAPRSDTIVGVSTVTSAMIGREPLASWVDGPSKRAVMDFVMRVSAAGGAYAVPEQDRIATFDNNGTLWPEKPLPEAAFVAGRLRAKAMEESKLRDQPSYTAVMTDGAEGLGSKGMEAVQSALAQTHAGKTDEAFEADARGFLFNARHPRFNAPYPSLAYKPMRELLVYLREHGFSIYLCTDEDEGFARAFAPDTYQIPREHIIGSSTKKELAFEKDGAVLRRTEKIASFNDKEEKAANISRYIGRRPLLAVGNVGTGGDIAMLTYTHGNTIPSLQLVIQHDDPARELAYTEPDDETLAAARERGFVVVSMKNDWSQVFDTPPPKKK